MIKFGITWQAIYASALTAIERKEKGSIGYRSLVDIANFSE
jgi:hypothetical protein